MGRVTAFEVNVYYYLNVLHTSLGSLPPHLCGKKQSVLDTAVTRVEQALRLLEEEDERKRTEEQKGTGGG